MSNRLDKELLKGAIDIHVHSGPSPFHRHHTNEIVQNALDYGLRALFLKKHHLNTSDRVHYVTREIPGIDVFSSVTLNYAVGGINPFAVDAGLKFGIKKVWGPTIDSFKQKEFYGSLGGYGAAMNVEKPECYKNATGIYILDEKGELIPEMKEILKMIAANDIIMGSGHLTWPELIALVKGAKKAGAKLVIDHPHLDFINLSIEQQKEIAAEGAYLNYCFSEITPKWNNITVKELAKQIREIGSEHIVMSSDLGQVHNSYPAEGLRVYIQVLLEEGITADEIDLMLRKNPAKLVYNE